MAFLGRLALGLLPLLLLIALLELGLWAAGLGGDGGRLSLSRGFDRDAAYIVPDTAVPGGYRTQMWEVDYLETEIPPPTDAKRLLMVGGSNTQGFPNAVLEMLLDIAEPRARWEVINLGRSGYGSERVSILLEQAVELLAPDVVLIYAGHNEFMERGFRDELAEQGAMSVSGRVAEALMGLRSMRMLSDHFEPELKQRSFDRKPEPRIIGRDKNYRRLDLAGTMRFWQAYRDNVAAMCRHARAAGARVVLCTILGNDFSSPYVAQIGRELGSDQKRAYGRLRKQALRLFPEHLRLHVVPPVRLDQPDWGVTLRPEEVDARLADPPAGPREVPALRVLEGRLATMPATDYPKARSVEGAHWSDPRLWTTTVYELLETMSLLSAGAVDEDEEQRLRLSEQAYRRALEVAPGHPQALFELGLVEYALGQTAEARELLGLAIDADRAPRRGNNISNDMLRELAATEPGVELLDVDRVWRERTPDGLLGYEVMTDVCHLQPGARAILMADFVPAIVAAGKRP